MSFLRRIIAIHRLASVKALLLPRAEYEKMSAALVKAKVFEEDYDTDQDAVPGKVFVTDSMMTWRDNRGDVLPIPGWLTQREIDRNIDQQGSDWLPDDLDLYNYAKAFFKGKPWLADAETKAKKYLKTPEGKARASKVL